MEDDEKEEGGERPVTPSKLSKTPSWITLGFALGALFVWSLPDAPPPPPPPTVAPATVRLERPVLSEIEAVFAQWSEHAVWKNDITEVAMWDTARKSYSLYYEVLRNGDVFYFRSIPQLTRPIKAHGVPENAPLQYTETEEMRREWMRARWEQSFAPPVEAPPRPTLPEQTPLKLGTSGKDRPE
jgi:hypothetical protein